jgi:hypothetical protein
MRLKVEYFDQNEAFARVLPQLGTVERWVWSIDGGRWGVCRLDTPVEYHGLVYGYFLLRSRWLNHEIGDKEATSVFILLVGDPASVTDGLSVRDFEHVAWGMVKRQPGV